MTVIAPITGASGGIYHALMHRLQLQICRVAAGGAMPAASPV